MRRFLSNYFDLLLQLLSVTATSRINNAGQCQVMTVRSNESHIKRKIGSCTSQASTTYPPLGMDDIRRPRQVVHWESSLTARKPDGERTGSTLYAKIWSELAWPRKKCQSSLSTEKNGVGVWPTVSLTPIWTNVTSLVTLVGPVIFRSKNCNFPRQTPTFSAVFPGAANYAKYHAIQRLMPFLQHRGISQHLPEFHGVENRRPISYT